MDKNPEIKKMLTLHGFDVETLGFALEKYVQKGMKDRALDVLAEMVVSGMRVEFINMLCRTAFEVCGHTAPMLCNRLVALKKEIEALPSETTIPSEPLARRMAAMMFELCRAKHTRIGLWYDFLCIQYSMYSGISSAEFPKTYDRFFGDSTGNKILRVWFGSFCYALEHKHEMEAIRLASVFEIISNRHAGREDLGDLREYKCLVSPSNPIVSGTSVAETPLALIYHRLASITNKNCRQFIQSAATINTRASLFSAVLSVLRDPSEVQQTEAVPTEEVNLVYARRPFNSSLMFATTDTYDIMKGRELIPPLEDWIFDFRHPVTREDFPNRLKTFAKKHKIEILSKEIHRSHPMAVIIPFESRTFKNLVYEHLKVVNPTDFEPELHKKASSKAFSTYVTSKSRFNMPSTYENERFNDFIQDASRFYAARASLTKKKRKTK